MVHQMKFSDEFYEFQELLSNLIANKEVLMTLKYVDKENYVNKEIAMADFDESYRLVKKKFAEVLEIALKAQQ